ncbi:MAG: hypothetical protein WD575_01845 [Nitriliruptoraceae bacterium]
MEIRSEGFRAWLADQAAGDFDAFLLRWIGNIHPDDFHHAQHHSDGVNNFQGFSDQQVADLLDAARRETDEDTRRQTYADAAERIVDLASYIHLYNADVVEAWLPRVHGYETRPDGATRFGDVRLS